MRSITALLDPSNIIKRLAEDANQEIKTQKIDEEDHDPIQPLIDVINGAVAKYQLDTARTGLKHLTAVINAAIGTEVTNIKKKKWKEKFFSDYLQRDLQHVCKLFADAKDEKRIMDAIVDLKDNVGKDSGDQSTVAFYTVEVLEAFGVGATNNRLKEAAKLAIQSLRYTGEYLGDKVWRLKFALEKVREVAGKKGEDFEDVVEVASHSLKVLSQSNNKIAETRVSKNKS
jgi:hypothetical protein